MRQIFCPRGAQAKVSGVVAIDGAYEDFPADERISLITLEGTKESEGVMIVRGTSGTTLVFNDALLAVFEPPA